MDRLFNLFNLRHRDALQPIKKYSPSKLYETDLSLPAWDQTQNNLKVATSAASELRSHFSELIFKESLSRKHEDKVIEFAERQRSMIKIDVGGQIFCTTRETLVSYPDSYFYGLLNSGQFLPDEEGTLSMECSL